MSLECQAGKKSLNADFFSFFWQRRLSSCGKLNNKPQTSRGASAVKHAVQQV
jgi:hypothetical protein